MALELSKETEQELRNALCTEKPKATGDVRIVILQRGWVAVGRWEKDGQQCRLRDCAIIRAWGTTKGLGEIAEGGPAKSTVLDKCPTLRFHELTVISTMDCVEEKWRKHL